MKRPSRSLLVLSLIVVAMVTSRCDCARAETSSGRCEGFVGALQIAADIDSVNSHYAIDHDQGLNLYFMRFGDGAVQIDGRVDRGYALSGGVELKLPGEVAGGGGDGGMGSADGGTGGGRPAIGSPEVKAWNFHTLDNTRPKITSGTLERSLDLVDRRLMGVMRLFFEDGTSLLCEFALRYEPSSDVGEDPEGSSGSGGSGGCGGGGGGDSDFD
jgi:hypothetical protein